MDKVRFGRALGYGARHAARTLTEAAKAVAAPSSSNASGTRPSFESRSRAAGRTFAAAPGQAKRASQPFLGNARRAAQTLWLQLTGTFFVLLALSFGSIVWHVHKDFGSSAAPDARHKAYFYTAFFAVFFYFAVSSFVRAAALERLARK